MVSGVSVENCSWRGGVPENDGFPTKQEHLTGLGCPLWPRGLQAGKPPLETCRSYGALLLSWMAFYIHAAPTGLGVLCHNRSLPAGAGVRCCPCRARFLLSHGLLPSFGPAGAGFVQVGFGAGRPCCRVELGGREIGQANCSQIQIIPSIPHPDIYRDRVQTSIGKNRKYRPFKTLVDPVGRTVLKNVARGGYLWGRKAVEKFTSLLVYKFTS